MHHVFSDSVMKISSSPHTSQPREVEIIHVHSQHFVILFRFINHDETQTQDQQAQTPC